ncbi:MAG: hypothetical protein CM1200mP41_24990 [Gammaproteobacteria bacterium]|nr:MAG: hypothetical protein CM1200mP41_24990 [Gammaproteobacteria bacterium]
MLDQYFPILMFLVTGLVVGGAALAAGSLLAPNKPMARNCLPMNVDLRPLRMLG